MNINDLFCTPEQGRRLKELVPELRSQFRWVKVNGLYPYKSPKSVHGMDNEEIASSEIALTLQELRDVANSHNLKQVEYAPNKIKITTDWSYFACHATAPELAAWVIERLEVR